MRLLDPWRAAHRLLSWHRTDTELRAAVRADELAKAGGEVGCRASKQILAALDELRRIRLWAGESRH